MWQKEKCLSIRVRVTDPEMGQAIVMVPGKIEETGDLDKRNPFKGIVTADGMENDQARHQQVAQRGEPIISVYNDIRADEHDNRDR
jgi:hypothetical protein